MQVSNEEIAAQAPISLPFRYLYDEVSPLGGKVRIPNDYKGFGWGNMWETVA